MSIVDELKKLIKARGGETTGVMTIADAVKVLTALEAAAEETSEETSEETPGETPGAG